MRSLRNSVKCLLPAPTVSQTMLGYHLQVDSHSSLSLEVELQVPHHAVSQSIPPTRFLPMSSVLLLVNTLRVQLAGWRNQNFI